MKLADPGLEHLVSPGGALDERQNLGSGFDGPFPAVDGFDLRDEIYAGSQLFLDQNSGDAPGRIGVGEGA